MFDRLFIVTRAILVYILDAMKKWMYGILDVSEQEWWQRLNRLACVCACECDRDGRNRKIENTYDSIKNRTYICCSLLFDCVWECACPIVKCVCYYYWMKRIDRIEILCMCGWTPHTHEHMSEWMNEWVSAWVSKWSKISTKRNKYERTSFDSFAIA